MATEQKLNKIIYTDGNVLKEINFETPLIINGKTTNIEKIPTSELADINSEDNLKNIDKDNTEDGTKNEDGTKKEGGSKVRSKKGMKKSRKGGKRKLRKSRKNKM
jgi:hypothetical protein